MGKISLPLTGIPTATTPAGKPPLSPEVAELHRLAEARLKNPPKSRSVPNTTDARRLVHELQVHQVELEMQNVALQQAQEAIEISLERYTDLYDFAPVAYFTLARDGRIEQVNLEGARLVAIDRSTLTGRCFARLLVPKDRPRFEGFLTTAFADGSRPNDEFDLLATAEIQLSIRIEAHRAPEKDHCLLAAFDITERLRAEKIRRRLEVLAATNTKLELEIVQRKEVERSLRLSERRQRHLMVKSTKMQDELRRLTHLILQTQEEERRRISRDLHDQITQTLVNISFHLESLSNDNKLKPRQLSQKIVETQKLVEQSVAIVHRFARDLRPPSLDHLGMLPALKSLIADFTDRSHLQINLGVFPEIEEMAEGERIVIYRVIQSALSNVLKHAEAQKVEILIFKEARHIYLSIADDGKSFDSRRLRYAKGDRRLGLLGMRERIEMIGGTFKIKGTPGQGTSVAACIPIKTKKNNAAISKPA